MINPATIERRILHALKLVDSEEVSDKRKAAAERRLRIFEKWLIDKATELLDSGALDTYMPSEITDKAKKIDRFCMFVESFNFTKIYKVYFIVESGDSLRINWSLFMK